MAERSNIKTEKFDLFKLHNPNEDNNNRRLLRVYSVIPKFSKIKTGEKAEQAIMTIKFLRIINEKLKNKVSPSWKEEWLNYIGYSFAQSSCKDWFIGRASIPLIAIEKLKLFGLEKEVNEFMESINYISSTTGEIVKIPKKFEPDLVYLIGLILGDGSLAVSYNSKKPNFEYPIGIHSGDKEVLILVQPIFSKLFEIPKPKITKYENERVWTLTKKSKTIYRFFTKIIGMPNGKKSHKAIIPLTIKNLYIEEQIPFLAGMVDSDIGKHSHGMGCTFANKQVVIDLVKLLNMLGVKAKVGTSNFLKNKYWQHDFRIPKSEVKNFKGVLERKYLPKRQDRLNILFQQQKQAKQQRR